MIITGENLIGGSAEPGMGGSIAAVDAVSGLPLSPPFASADRAAVSRACRLAAESFDTYRESGPVVRAGFLEAIGRRISSLGDDLIVRAMAETGLPRARLEGERARTVGQLGLFAEILRDGSFLDLRIDRARPDRTPLPRVDLRLRNIPLGPVAVFGASNFPLAFSVAGGDTASALAAGCPVVVKAHSGHPGTSELVGRAVQAAVADMGLPDGVFSLLFGEPAVGRDLVSDPRIAAVGFTGSRAGGLALTKIAQNRSCPIPVYAEMSSINPVILLPHALTARGAGIGRAFVAALTQGAGQFCTNPGLILGISGPGLDTFLTGAGAALAAAPPAVMLTGAIRTAYLAGVAALAGHPAVTRVAQGQTGGEREAGAVLFAADAQAFLADPTLQAEVFGACGLVVRCRDLDEIRTVLDALEGQLTAALHIDAADHQAAASLLPILERKAGRILVNGFGTGVEVGQAMVHGGPFPATGDGRSTSVGGLAIARFLRPVCYQDLPDDLLPPALKADNPLRLPRRIDGRFSS